MLHQDRLLQDILQHAAHLQRQWWSCKLWQGLKQGDRKMPGQFPKADQRLCEKEHLLKGCRNPQQWQGSQGADLPLRQGGLQEQHGHQRLDGPGQEG